MEYTYTTVAKAKRLQPIALNGETAQILLAAVIIARSTSFLFAKILLQSMGPFTLLGVRFLIAFAFLAVVFHKKLTHLHWQTLLRGFLLGVAFFGVMAAELYSLQTAPSSTVSFLENTAIVFVPLLEGILRRKCPRVPMLFSMAVTLLGIGLLAIPGGGIHFSMKRGESLSLLAAVLYAIVILSTDRFSRKDDSFVLGILQVGFIGLFAIIAAFLFETPRLPSGQTEWILILVLAFVCSGFGFTLQPVAQKYTSAERAGMFCAFSPVSAAILGRIFLHESLGIMGFVGAALVLSGIFISTLVKQKEPK